MSEETTPSTPNTPPPGGDAKGPAPTPAEGAPSADAAQPRAKIKLPGAGTAEAAARPKLTIRKSAAAETPPAPSDPLFDAKKETVRIELPPRPGGADTVKLPPQAKGPVQADHEAAEVKSSTVKLTVPRAAPPRPPAGPPAQQPKSETARISLPAQEQIPGVGPGAFGPAGLRVRREEPAEPPPPEPPPPEPPPVEELPPPAPEVVEPAPEPVRARTRGYQRRPVRARAEEEMDVLSAVAAVFCMLVGLGVAVFLFLQWQGFEGMLR